MAKRFSPPPGRALGASPGLDDSLLDEVNDYLGEVALNPPGPLSPKSERLKKMALAAKEAARRATARVQAAETAAQEQRDTALRAQAQLDLLRDLHGRAANLHAGPAGGSAGVGVLLHPSRCSWSSDPFQFLLVLGQAGPHHGRNARRGLPDAGPGGGEVPGNPVTVRGGHKGGQGLGPGSDPLGSGCAIAAGPLPRPGPRRA